MSRLDDEAGLTQLADGRATQPSDHALVGGLAADGGGVRPRTTSPLIRKTRET